MKDGSVRIGRRGRSNVTINESVESRVFRIFDLRTSLVSADGILPTNPQYRLKCKVSRKHTLDGVLDYPYLINRLYTA